jgi:putative endopeptidase
MPIGGWGVDLSGRDLAIKPGDDFDAYANGAWKARTPIPADRPQIGTLALMDEQVQGQMRALVEQAPRDGKVGALYASFLDEAAIEKRGLAPLLADLAPIRALSDKTAFARAMGAAHYGLGNSLFGFYVGPDTADATQSVLTLGQSGLGLPDRDYYLLPRFARQRGAYLAYIARTLKAVGEKNPEAGAQAILTFETSIASLSWDVARRRDRNATNNPMSLAELEAFAPGFDWAAFFEGGKVPRKSA